MMTGDIGTKAVSNNNKDAMGNAQTARAPAVFATAEWVETGPLAGFANFWYRDFLNVIKRFKEGENKHDT